VSRVHASPERHRAAAERAVTAGCFGLLLWVADLSAETDTQAAARPIRKTDAAEPPGTPEAASYLTYYPFKTAGANTVESTSPSPEPPNRIERRGKGLTGSEVAAQPEGSRQYLWKPFLYHDSPTEEERNTPDISTPGADTANFPNSAFTLPEGRFYFENSPIGFYGSSRASPSQYNWELFYRYGVTDNLEFRLFTSGLTVVDGSPTTVGFSPATFDLKYNLWEENTDYLIPAVGIESYVQTTWGSASTVDGTQVAWSINVDHSLPFDLAFEWNVGSTQIFTPGGRSIAEANGSWSLQRDITDSVALFIHAYHNAASLPRGAISNLDPQRGFHRINGHVVGAGAIWTVGEKMQVFGSVNAGTKTAPSFIGLLGFALAF
jgi:hypothetical protein